MKKNSLPVIIGVFALLLLGASCKKDYHCQCSYNNQVMMVKDLGFRVQSDAKDACTAYDSTVTGEKWNCVIY